LKDKKKICVVFSHHKLGDLIWQLPYIKAISEHFNEKIYLVVREKTQAKDILKDCDYIKEIKYNNFRKKIYYFVEIFKLWKYFKSENFSHTFFLDKVNRGAIAAKFAKIPNRIGLGFKNQKKWITNKSLNDSIYKENQSEQSKYLLENNGIKIKDPIPSINIKKENLVNIEPDISKYRGKKIALGIDSFELFKIWYEEYFAELSDRLYEADFCNYFYLVCGQKNKYIADKIIKLSNNNNFIDCSHLNLLGIIKVIKDSEFFIGNNSGPLNLSSALNIKSYGIIANDPVSELKNSKIIPILPDDYKDNIWIKNREGMSRLSVDKVFNFICSREKKIKGLL
tara:strand:+ start:131 stop:1147 length:1017 start_codon:yes stop_codon:yes gene_type:complete